MSLRHVLPITVWAFATSLVVLPAGAETLADVRAELGQLSVEFNALKSELTTTGAAARVGGSDALARMDTLEAELMRLTSRAEEIELRLNRVISDGTNRLGDIEFRLCDLDPGCDPLNMTATPTLGGEAASATPAPAQRPQTSSTPALAVAEQADFDRAKEVLGQGDFQGAATLFETYAQSYPGGPLVPEAHYLRGEALRQAGQSVPAARAYLNAYSSAPTGTYAADSVLKLGKELGNLGEVQQACLTLGQLQIEFAGSTAAAEAPAAMATLGCS